MKKRVYRERYYGDMIPKQDEINSMEGLVKEVSKKAMKEVKETKVTKKKPIKKGDK